MKKQGSEAPLFFHGLIHEKRQSLSAIIDFSAVPFIGPKGATLPWVQYVCPTYFSAGPMIPDAPATVFDRVESLLGENEVINFNAGDHGISVSMRHTDYLKVEKPELGKFSE